MHPIIQALEEQEQEILSEKASLEETLLKLTDELKHTNKDLVGVQGALRALRGGDQGVSPANPDPPLATPAVVQDPPIPVRIPTGRKCGSCGAFEVRPAHRELSNGKTLNYQVCGECLNEVFTP